jgi:hypothetical protein
VVIEAIEIVPESVMVPPSSPSPAVMLVTVPDPPPPLLATSARMLIISPAVGASTKVMVPPAVLEMLYLLGGWSMPPTLTR